MTATQPPIKVLMVKPGLDGHWRGAMVVSMALRDAGMEVIYGGNQSPAALVKTALHEDVDVIGLSIYSAGYRQLIDEVMAQLAAQETRDVLVVVGGTIPPADIPLLKSQGVDEVFLPGTPVERIVDYLTAHVRRQEPLPQPTFTVTPIGYVHRPETPSTEVDELRRQPVTIVIDPALTPALEGIEQVQKLVVIFYCHHTSGFPLRVHPRGDPCRQPRGVLASRSPARPNPLGLTVVFLRRVQGNVLHVQGFDALDGTPVLDIKPFDQTFDDGTEIT